MIDTSRIPEWVLKTLAEKTVHRWTGGVTIMFSDGGIRNIHKETEVEHPPREAHGIQKK